MIKNYTLEGSQTPVKLESVQQTGFGVTGHVVWNIISPRRLTSDEILEIVEGEYPPEGYGTSLIGNGNARGESFVYEIISAASCD